MLKPGEHDAPLGLRVVFGGGFYKQVAPSGAGGSEGPPSSRWKWWLRQARTGMFMAIGPPKEPIHWTAVHEKCDNLLEDAALSGRTYLACFSARAFMLRP
jgi:hypothetical protein